MKALITGANGFIAGYLVAELLEHGYDVVGVDNFSKYGRVSKSYDHHQRFHMVEADAKNLDLMKELLRDCDHFIAGAAMIGGISYFHHHAYDLLAENERITAAAFDAAIWAHKEANLKKITVMSSSMVFESTAQFPTPEGAQFSSPPPLSSYGFQKLSTEYFARAAFQQFGLPFTIVRPFNCVGIGEQRALGDVDIYSGNVRLAMSHVVPDLVQKIVKGQNPLRILGKGDQVRHYTYGGDLARGIRACIEHPATLNEDFNISTEHSTTVLELAALIWKKINGETPFRHVSDEPFEHDVQKRVPDVSKAKRVLGFEAHTSLDQMLDEVIPWIQGQVTKGTI
jgi:UDP-glucose 4-epimerase